MTWIRLQNMAIRECVAEFLHTCASVYHNVYCISPYRINYIYRFIRELLCDTLMFSMLTKKIQKVIELI